MKDVVVIGAGLTGLCTAHHLTKAGLDTLVLEQKKQIGGVIQTGKEDGFLFEQGPNTGVVGNVEVLKLFKDLEGLCEIELAKAINKKRYILKNGIWEALPSGLLSAIKTPLFSLKDKFRILGEPWRPKGNDPHESLANLVKRRMGKSFLDYAIDPFIIGVYAGDPAQLVPKYALPKLYNLEQTYGSFIKGSMQKKKEPKTAEEQAVSRSVFSVKGGLSNLIYAIANKVGTDRIHTQAQGVTIVPENGVYNITYTQNGITQTVVSKQVISTAGAYQLNQIFPFIDTDKMQKLQNLNYTSVVQVVLGFEQWQGIPLDGFGGLIPFKEERDILGAMYISSMFDDRASREGALLSIFMGGVRRPDIYKLNDETIKILVQREVQTLMQLKDFNPKVFKLIRYRFAIPQYEANSSERFETIDWVQSHYKGLIVGGNIRNGIGMADRILQAKQLAEQAIKQHH